MRTKAFSTLYSIAISGKVKVWDIHVEERGPKRVDIVVETGYEDGKRTPHVTTITEGKNLGKKNETTPYEQAILEAQSKWNKKRDREGFQESIPTTSSQPILAKTEHTLPFVRPMLAKTYEPTKAGKQKKGIKFPCAMQPKLDGHRTITSVHLQSGDIVHYSRNGVRIDSVPHIAPVIQGYLMKKGGKDWAIIQQSQVPVVWLDGELYTDQVPFETLSGLLRRKSVKEMTLEDLEKSKQIQYWIFDIYVPTEPGLTFQQRYDILERVKWWGPLLKLVPNTNAESPKDVERILQEYLKKKMEGAILRNWDAPYAVGQRSSDLQKYKLFQDAEFPIIGFHEGRGDEEGAIIWECEVPKGLSPNDKGAQKTFSVRPTGTREERKNLFHRATKNFKEFKGKLLTVKFQDWTEDGVPRFPEGIAIRWDL